MAFRKAEWQRFLDFMKRRFPGRFGSDAGEREVVEWLRGKIRTLRSMPDAEPTNPHGDGDGSGEGSEA